MRTTLLRVARGAEAPRHFAERTVGRRHLGNRPGSGGLAWGRAPAAEPAVDDRPVFDCAFRWQTDHPFRWQTDHLFRRKSITRSDANRSPVGAKRRGTRIMSPGSPFGSTAGFAFASSLLSVPHPAVPDPRIHETGIRCRGDAGTEVGFICGAESSPRLRFSLARRAHLDAVPLLWRHRTGAAPTHTCFNETPASSMTADTTTATR